jgi:spermidine synthase
LDGVDFRAIIQRLLEISFYGKDRVTRFFALRSAFFLSGVAGLVYEVLWSRYLGLFVGHGAYAQVLVLAVYLGGMAVGALAVADLSRRISEPLRWYAGAEALLALFGLAFHGLFVGVTELSYSVLFPAVGSAAWVGALRWGLAGALVLPQAIVLGATFPLMAAALVRRNARAPGGGVALAYLLNTVGGAVGVPLAGFALIGWLGLSGTSVAAAVLNLAAAALIFWSYRRASARADGDVGSGPAGPSGIHVANEGQAMGFEGAHRPGLPAMLLTVAFGTAVASFAYEIGWMRMLSLVLGSATHAFEIMLSAFILGLAIGALAIRRRSDASPDPLRMLGHVQVCMGLTALLSLPAYLVSFDVMAWMVPALSGRPGGWTAFNLGRYALSLLVMLPSTVLAGMTLPLISGTLMRAGQGERAIGRVYGINTIGAVLGVAAAGLLALPILGLEGLITAGAALDVALGLWLLARSGRWTGAGVRGALPAAGVAGVLFLGVTAAVDFDPAVVASGVFRQGDTGGEDRLSLYYQDGRTATVSAHVGTADGVIVLATNGKPDASIGPRWIMERRDTLPVLPIPQGRDYTTQVLAPAITLAHRPDARVVANVGHGSGITTTSLLTGPAVERLVTLEIEPLMVEGSLVFWPANRAAFEDPRVSYAFDDARSFFSYRQERFDLVFAEPSNPWVRGTAGLFTREFYERVAAVLGDGGVLGQWVQIYELDDDLFLSVLAAVDAVFPAWRAYLVGDADVVIVATARDTLREPDWSVVATEGFEERVLGAPPFLPQHMEALLLFDSHTLRPVLDRGVRLNSDFRPVLDLGSERTRFEQAGAAGAYSFGTSRVDLGAHLAGRRREGHGYATPPAYGLAPVLLSERGNWLRGAMEAGGGIAPEEFPEWEEELVHLQTFLFLTASSVQLGRWDTWASGFIRAENALHWGTTGWIEPTFYRNVYGFLDRAGAPPEARAVVDLMHAYALGDWPRVAEGVDRLVTLVALGGRWMPPDLLMDIAVLAYLEMGRPAAAVDAIERLSGRTGRRPDHLRTRLLRALAADAATGR